MGALLEKCYVLCVMHYAFVQSTNAYQYTLAMDNAFIPRKELQKLLGPTPAHPWAALIPQILLWCFRRFCVQKLIMFEGTLEESLCEDIMDIVHTYCPKGLEMVSIEWFTPENIEQVASPLEKYMAFFVRFCKYLDSSIYTNDYENQDILSDFLDVSMGSILSEWLDAKHACFLIFPTEAENDDEFKEVHFSKLINSLLIYSYAEKGREVEVAKKEVAEPVVVPPPVAPVYRSSSSLLWQLISIPKHPPPPPPQESLPMPPLPPDPMPLPLPPQELEAAVAPPVTVSEAIHRRRTMCVKGRRAQQPRVKTRKTHPTPYTKEEV